MVTERLSAFGVLLVGALLVPVAKPATVSGNDSGNSILQGASWRLDQRPRALKRTTWIDSQGTAAEVLAFADEFSVTVSTSSVSPIRARAAITRAGGRIYAQLPALGEYWAHVPARQQEFLESLRRVRGIAEVLPNFAIHTKALPGEAHADKVANRFTTVSRQLPIHVLTGHMVLDDFTLDDCLDDDCGTSPHYIGYRDGQVQTASAFPGCTPIDGGCAVVFRETTHIALAASHGDIVRYYLTNGYRAVNAGQRPTLAAVDLVPDFDDTFQATGLDRDLCSIAALIHAAARIRQAATINHSVGVCEYQTSGLSDCGLSISTTGRAASNSLGQQHFLSRLTAILATGRDGAKDALLIQAAGNAAADLGPTLDAVRRRFGSATDQVVLVGALVSQGNRGASHLADYSNYSSTVQGVIYVPVTGRTDHDHLLAGTSFAAPQVAYLVNQLRTARPDLKPSQVREVLFDQSVAPLRTIVRQDGSSLRGNVIDDVYRPAELASAIEVASSRFPRP